MNALRIAVCLSWRSVGRGKTSAVGDDPKSRGERLYLCSKGVQIPEAAMNEDEWFSLTAFKVMERGFVDLNRLDLGATCTVLSFWVGEDVPSASSVSMRIDDATVIGIMATS